MNSLYLILFFIFGSVFGSFYGVIGERLPKGENFTTSHSHCNSCSHELKLYDMVPIMTYLFNKGRCRYCHTKIPIMLPLLELTTGLLFAVSYYSFGFSYDLLIAFGVVSILTIVLVTDLTYYIIPDEVLLFFTFYFIVIQFLKSGFNSTCTHVVTGVFLFLLMYFIMWFGEKIFKKESLGGGDVKLLFVFGLVLEPLIGVLTIFLGSLLALPVALVILLTNKEHMIPFGPFLAVANAILFFSKVTTYDFLFFWGI